MFTVSKRLLPAAVAAALLAGCASPMPRVSGAPGFVLSAVDAEGAGPGGTALAAALEASPLALNGAPIPAYAAVTVDLVRQDSPFFGLFYGGPDHATLSVRLTDAGGGKLDSFQLHVGVDADGAAADAALAEKAVAIIAARAASAWPAMTAKPKASPRPEPVAPAAAPADEAAPEVAPDVASEPADAGIPCVIGADGRCLPL